MRVYTFAWDDDNGTGCSVHSTERERDIAFIDHVTEGFDDGEKAEAMRILDSEDENDDLWGYLEENCFEHLATYGLDQDELPDPAIMTEMREALAHAAVSIHHPACKCHGEYSANPEKYCGCHVYKAQAVLEKIAAVQH